MYFGRQILDMKHVQFCLNACFFSACFFDYIIVEQLIMLNVFEVNLIINIFVFSVAVALTSLC
jgi:hypothetical protein